MSLVISVSKPTYGSKLKMVKPDTGYPADFPDIRYPTGYLANAGDPEN